MKLQHLSVIFVIIIMPIVLVLSAYIGNLIDVQNKKARYDAVLLNSTYDAVRAYQMNTLNNTFASANKSRERDINASVNSFFNSLASGLQTSGYTKTELNTHIPALLFTLYDGFYTYGPYSNVATVNKEEGHAEYSQKGSQSSNIEYGVKPFTYYSCEYKNGTRGSVGYYDIIVNYTLDNYIAVSGEVYNADPKYNESNHTQYFTRAGYYINPNKVTIYPKDTTTESGKYYPSMTIVLGNNPDTQIALEPELLGEYISTYSSERIINSETNRSEVRTNPPSDATYYNYINYKEEKYYYDDELAKTEGVKQGEANYNYNNIQNVLQNQETTPIPIFYLTNNQKIYINTDLLKELASYRGNIYQTCDIEELVNKNKFQDVNAFWYYDKAVSFSEYIHPVLSKIDLTKDITYEAEKEDDEIINGVKARTVTLDNCIIKTDSYHEKYTIAPNQDDTENTSHIKTSYANPKIFDYTDNNNDPELISSSFNEHRMDVIISTIEGSLANAIGNFNNYIASAYDFQMPALSENEWYTISNNVTVGAFMQGLVIGNYQYYSNYTVVANTKNKEFISKDSIFVQDDYVRNGQNMSYEFYQNAANNNYYSNPICVDYHKERNDENKNVVGYRNIDYEVQNYSVNLKNDDGEEEGITTNYYMQPGTGAYDCVVSQNSNLFTTDDLMNVETLSRKARDQTYTINNEVRRAYIEALAREKGASFKSFDNYNYDESLESASNNGIPASDFIKGVTKGGNPVTPPGVPSSGGTEEPGSGDAEKEKVKLAARGLSTSSIEIEVTNPKENEQYIFYIKINGIWERINSNPQSSPKIIKDGLNENTTYEVRVVVYNDPDNRDDGTATTLIDVNTNTQRPNDTAPTIKSNVLETNTENSSARITIYCEQTDPDTDNNTLSIQFRMRTKNGSYPDWSQSTIYTSTNSFRLYGFNGLDQDTEYVFQTRASDGYVDTNSGEQIWIESKETPIIKTPKYKSLVIPDIQIKQEPTRWINTKRDGPVIVTAIQTSGNDVVQIRKQGTTNGKGNDLTNISQLQNDEEDYQYGDQYGISNNIEVYNYGTIVTGVLTSNNNTPTTSNINAMGTLTVTNIDNRYPTDDMPEAVMVTQDSIRVDCVQRDLGSGDNEVTSASGIEDVKYRINDGAWQDSGTFEGLTLDTEYRIETKVIDKAGNETISKTLTQRTQPELKYAVTLEKGTYITSVSGAGLYKPGDTVTVNATVQSGAYFDEWKEISINSSLQEEQLTRSVNTTYTFAMPNYNVTLLATGMSDNPEPERVEPYITMTQDPVKWTNQNVEVTAVVHDPFDEFPLKMCTDGEHYRESGSDITQPYANNPWIKIIQVERWRQSAYAFAYSAESLGPILNIDKTAPTRTKPSAAAISKDGKHFDIVVTCNQEDWGDDQLYYPESASGIKRVQYSIDGGSTWQDSPKFSIDINKLEITTASDSELSSLLSSAGVSSSIRQLIINNKHSYTSITSFKNSIGETSYNKIKDGISVDGEFDKPIKLAVATRAEDNTGHYVMENGAKVWHDEYGYGNISTSEVFYVTIGEKTYDYASVTLVKGTGIKSVQFNNVSYSSTASRNVSIGTILQIRANKRDSWGEGWNYYDSNKKRWRYEYDYNNARWFDSGGTLINSTDTFYIIVLNDITFEARADEHKYRLDQYTYQSTASYSIQSVYVSGSYACRRDDGSPHVGTGSGYTSIKSYGIHSGVTTSHPNCTGHAVIETDRGPSNNEKKVYARMWINSSSDGPAKYVNTTSGKGSVRALSLKVVFVDNNGNTVERTSNSMPVASVDFPEDYSYDAWGNISRTQIY